MATDAHVMRSALPIAGRWGLLILLAILLAGLFQWLRLPAALLLGPMIAAILLACRGTGVRIAGLPLADAMGIVGTMIAGNLPPSLFGEIAASWPIFLLGTFSTLIASSAIGWMMMRRGGLPETTRPHG